MDASVSRIDPWWGAVAPSAARRYAWYALALLVVANILNYADRTIISVLAEAIKGDLHLKDSQLGFLYGTAFVVFNAVFSVVMGRVADAWMRGRLMAIGLVIWSGATVLSGFASGFAGLAVARLSVGIGEATINPCSHSLLTTLFPPRLRATVLSIYLCGVFVGMAASIALGGWFAENWSTACTTALPALCGFKGWQIAFLIAGTPGLLLALLLYRLKEPRRQDVAPLSVPGLLRLTGSELGNLLPPFSLLRLASESSHRVLRINLLTAAILTTLAAVLIWLTGDWMQWIGLGFGLYALLSWGHVLSMRDPDVYRVTMGSPAFRYALLGYALVGSISQAMNFWAIPFAIRTIHLSPARSGALIGAVLGAGSVIGIIGGGWITDIWRRRDPRAPLIIGVVGLVVSGCFALALLSAETERAFILGYAGFALTSQWWSGAIAAYVQDLSPSRMRATSAASFATSMILISFATGPYLAGRLGELTGSLRTGLLSLYVFAPFAVLLLVAAGRALPAAFACRDEIEARASSRIGQ